MNHKDHSKSFYKFNEIYIYLYARKYIRKFLKDEITIKIKAKSKSNATRCLPKPAGIFVVVAGCLSLTIRPELTGPHIEGSLRFCPSVMVLYCLINFYLIPTGISPPVSGNYTSANIFTYSEPQYLNFKVSRVRK